MQKIALAGAVAAGLAVIGLLGVPAWMQHRVEAEVDAVFATLQAAGVTATHGPVTYDYWSRTLTIPTLGLATAGEGDLKTIVATIVAHGLTREGGAILADQVEVTGLEIKLAATKDEPWTFAQAIPKLTVTKFAAPEMLPRSGSTLELMRYLAKVKAAVVDVPQGEAGFEAQQVGGAGLFNRGKMKYLYTNVTIKNLRDGYIGALNVDKIALASDPSAGGVKGLLNGYASADMDLLTMLSLYGVEAPARPATDGYVRVQGKTTMGTYTFSVGPGMNMTVDSVTSGDLAIDPTKFNRSILADFMKLSPQPGVRQSPSQTADLANKVVQLYESFKLADVEMRGMRITTAFGQPGMGMVIGSMRMAGFQNGRLAEFAINDMALTIPGVPLVKIGHLSLAGLDMARIMRTTAVSGAGLPPSAGQSLALFSALEGFEVRDYDVPDFKSGKFIGRIDTLKTAWGKFSNGLPTITRLTMKAQMPIDDSQPAFAFLKPLGRERVVVTYDIGTTWNEATQALTTAPLTLELEGLGALSGSIVLNSASRQPIGLDAARMLAAFQAMDVGAITLKVRDGGGTKAYIASGANAAGPLVDAKARLMAAPVPNVGAITVLDAASRFLDTPGQTLTLTLNPKSKVSVSQFSGPAMAVDGGAALLDLFTVEAAVEK